MEVSSSATTTIEVASSAMTTIGVASWAKTTIEFHHRLRKLLAMIQDPTQISVAKYMRRGATMGQGSNEHRLDPT